LGEAKISPDEFLHRCERVKAEYALGGKERQQLTRELAALCALTGARAESLYDHNSQLTGLRVSDPGGNLVISGPVDEVLAGLVAMPASHQDRGPGRSVRRGSRDARTTAPPADKLAAVIQAWHSAVELEPRHLAHFAGRTRPDTPRLNLVGLTGSSRPS
jgi:hypothetical protein